MIEELIIKLQELRSWFSSQDYLINKHYLGELTDKDTKWINYLTERKEKLAEIRNVESELKSLGVEI